MGRLVVVVCLGWYGLIGCGVGFGVGVNDLDEL